MCELFAMSASTPVKVRYDLERFAREGGEKHQNRDGWGIAFSDGNDAHYFREASPASNSPLDRFVREHAEPHAFAVAHVRRATQGKRLLANTHPFRRTMHGRLQHFAHNGGLDGLEDLPEAKKLLGERIGDTDSELAFIILLERLNRNAADPADHLARFEVFRDFCSEMSELGSANFLWLDRDTLYVHADRRRYETENGMSEPRTPGLHLLRSESRSLGSRHECAGADMHDLPDELMLFASIPLSDGPWEPLERGTVMAIAEGRIAHREQVEAG